MASIDNIMNEVSFFATCLCVCAYFDLLAGYYTSMCAAIFLIQSPRNTSIPRINHQCFAASIFSRSVWSANRVYIVYVCMDIVLSYSAAPHVVWGEYVLFVMASTPDDEHNNKTEAQTSYTMVQSAAADRDVF